jgi:hypothetical protein
VSSDFGQLAVRRHLSSGIDCAMAGAASVAAPAAPMPVTLRKSLLFIESIPVGERVMAFFGEAFGASMEQPVPDFHPELYGQTKKPGLLAKAGLLSTT